MRTGSSRLDALSLREQNYTGAGPRVAQLLPPIAVVLGKEESAHARVPVHWRRVFLRSNFRSGDGHHHHHRKSRLWPTFLPVIGAHGLLLWLLFLWEEEKGGDGSPKAMARNVSRWLLFLLPFVFRFFFFVFLNFFFCSLFHLFLFINKLYLGIRYQTLIISSNFMFPYLRRHRG